MVRKSISYLSIALLCSPLVVRGMEKEVRQYLDISDSQISDLKREFEQMVTKTPEKEAKENIELFQRMYSEQTPENIGDTDRQRSLAAKLVIAHHVIDEIEKIKTSVPPMRSNKESNEEGDCSNYISPLDTVDTKYRGMHPLGKLIKYTLFLPVVGLWEFHCRIQNVLGNKPEETVVHFGPDSDSSSSSNGIKSMSMSSSSSSPSDPVKFVKSPNTSDEDTIFSDVMDADELNMNRIKYKVIYDSYCQERAQREAVQANLSPAMQREARNSNLGKELLQRKYADAVIDMIQLENPDSEINYSAEWKGYVMEDLTSYYRKNFKALEDVPSE